MSRSIRNRHNKSGVNIKFGGSSDKQDKRIANRKFRRHETLEEKETLLALDDMFKTTNIKDVSNTWNFRSDGLAYYTSLDCDNKWRSAIPKNERYKYKNK